MPPLTKLSLVDQTYAWMKDGLAENRWHGRLPGERKLALELKVSRKTLGLVLRRMKNEGLVETRKGCEGRFILTAPSPAERTGSLRIGHLILTARENEDREEFRAPALQIAHGIELMGHTPVVVQAHSGIMTGKSGRIKRLVESARADAWIVTYGTAELLKSFAELGVPVIADGGASSTISGIAKAGYPVAPGLSLAVEKLLSLGHRRIVLITPAILRHNPGSDPLICRAEKLQKAGVTSSASVAFLDTLKKAGIKATEYNLPTWDGTPEGLDALLESLFRFTPPTALIVWDSREANAVLGYLARHRLSVPRDVSLVILESTRTLAWHHPGMDFAQLSKIDESVTVRNILRWVKAVAEGKPCEGDYFSPAPEFHPGNTLAPPKA